MYMYLWKWRFFETWLKQAIPAFSGPYCVIILDYTKLLVEFPLYLKKDPHALFPRYQPRRQRVKISISIFSRVGIIWSTPQTRPVINTRPPLCFKWFSFQKRTKKNLRKIDFIFILLFLRKSCYVNKSSRGIVLFQRTDNECDQCCHTMPLHSATKLILFL